MLADPVYAQTVRKNVIHTWESVGTITQINGKTFDIRGTVKLSESTWSLLPRAASDASQLQMGSTVHVKGSTLPDGIYDAKRIFIVSDPASWQQASTGGGIVQGSDHGGPEIKAPIDATGTSSTGLEDRGRGIPGRENRLPTGRPGDANRGAPGGLQTSQGAGLPRFLPGDIQGVVEQTGSDTLVLTQAFYIEKKTTIVGIDGDRLKLKDLRLGQRVAVPIKDELDEKSQSRQALVIRLLP